MTVRISNKATGVTIGDLSGEDFQFLVDHLEEESSRDDDYFIDAPTVEMLDHVGASPNMVALLRGAVGTADGIDITWERRPG